MELAVLLLVLLLADKRTRAPTRGAGALSDELSDLLESDWFQKRSFGGVSGKEIAQAADAVRGIAEQGESLHGLLQKGDLSSLLSSLGGQETGDLLKKIEGAATLARGMGGLGSLFGAPAQAPTSGADGAENGAERENPFAPIANIANEEIVYALTRYFA